MSKDILETKLGGPVPCSVCGRMNPAGGECRWCNETNLKPQKYIEIKDMPPGYIKTVDKYFKPFI